MSPDDPRHGTPNAGPIAHHRSGTPLCLPCEVAQRRAKKQLQMRLARGIRNRVPLGQRAWDILNNVGPTPVAEATGLWRNNLYRAQRGGPDQIVLRSTRDAILRVQAPTHVGLQRRMQALAAIGHTFEVLGAETGIHPEWLGRMCRAVTPPNVSMQVSDAIVAVYDKLRAVEPTGRWATGRRNRSARRGWLSPLVWDDIDDPNEDPLAPDGEDHEDTVDESVVERLISFRRMPSTRAEKEEAMRRWIAAGRSQKALCEFHGWKQGRYVVRQDGAA